MVDTFDFTTFETANEKENFVKSLIEKQINLSKDLINIYNQSPILNLHFVLLTYVKHTDFHKILTQKLNGVLTSDEYVKLFSNTIEEYVDNLLLLAAIKKLSNRKKKWPRHNPPPAAREKSQKLPPTPTRTRIPLPVLQ